MLIFSYGRITQVAKMCRQNLIKMRERKTNESDTEKVLKWVWQKKKSTRKGVFKNWGNHVFKKEKKKICVDIASKIEFHIISKCLLCLLRFMTSIKRDLLASQLFLTVEWSLFKKETNIFGVQNGPPKLNQT